MAEQQKPIPLNLDWKSPEGIAHHEQMSKLPWNDPVAISHFENIGKVNPKTPAPASKKDSA